MLRCALIICTYQRPDSILQLMQSIEKQTVLPNQVIIVDGSQDDKTKLALAQISLAGLEYHKVDGANRGLTKQRNFGIKLVSEHSQIVCLLDDDVILDKNYFKEILGAYAQFPETLGVGGYITNEVDWVSKAPEKKYGLNYFCFDGWARREGLRFKVRRILRLDSNVPPGHTPLFSHGRSISHLPPSGKIYNVEQLMGGVASYRKSVFENHAFSSYFEGYGLYEDADFSIRVSKIGALLVNTKAKLSHHHAAGGRPNSFKYGKMVVRNGYYVWRVKNPRPRAVDRFKWHAITLLLMSIRALNIMTGPKRKQAFFETVGRKWGWLSLWFNAPNPS